MNALPPTRLPGLLAPRWVVLQVTEACNLRCRMCYECGQNGMFQGRAAGAMLEAKTIQALVRECAPYRPYFGLFGGEPLLHPQLPEILECFHASGCGFDIPTNGTLLEHQAEWLVRFPPTRLWISLDGPEPVNDYQRGAGVYARVIRGIQKLHAWRASRGAERPRIGVTFLVTPDNHRVISDLFLRALPLELLNHLSIEFQCYATPQQVRGYRQVLASEFGVQSAACAQGFEKDADCFAGMDFDLVASQMQEVRAACERRGIYFVSYPKTLTVENIRSYFTGQWHAMADRRRYCSFPWLYAEISARGEVTVCHTFYDLVLGNIYEDPLLEIWQGEKIRQVRQYLRKQLYPICTACSRYYADPAKH